MADAIIRYWCTILGQAEDVDQKKTWQPTQYANIVRHVPSGIYYARLRIKGKLMWRSVKTDKISVAKTKLGDVEKEEQLHLRVPGGVRKNAIKSSAGARKRNGASTNSRVVAL